MRRLCGLALLVGILSVQPAGAITLSQDFDSGSLDVAASTINGSTVSLVGRRTWTDPSTERYYRWVYFKASDVAGLQPLFKISYVLFYGSLNDHRYLYSYDQSNWQYFDNCYYGGNGYEYLFQNNQPFAQNDVYIAYSLPYPLSRTQAHMAAVTASPFVSPTTSGGGGFVVGRTAGGVDDLGRTIAPNDLYGFKIADPFAPGTRRKVLLSGGNHPCETPGSHALEGMVDFLLSDAPEAVGLRRLADFYVYPELNPDGRVAGYYRSTPEVPTADHNRYWHNPAGLTDITAARNAMILDTGGDVDYLFDFHSMFGPWTRSPYYEVVPSDAGCAFAQALAILEPGIAQSATWGDPGMLRIWGQSTAGLKAEHSFTPEFGCHVGTLETRLDEMGANYARALYRALIAGMTLIPGDATHDGVVDELDAARLAAYWGQSGVTWAMGDFNRDGVIGPADASILAANWGYGTAEAAAVPEPSVFVLALAALASLAPWRRRR
jgi:hypothetical protein